MFIGNGGSAAIANHQAIDFTNSGKFRAMTFNESSALTCIANDYGYDQVFAHPIRTFAEEGDMLVAISSSGKSKNILEGVKAACQVAYLLAHLVNFGFCLVFPVYYHLYVSLELFPFLVNYRFDNFFDLLAVYLLLLLRGLLKLLNRLLHVRLLAKVLHWRLLLCAHAWRVVWSVHAD